MYSLFTLNFFSELHIYNGRYKPSLIEQVPQNKFLPSIISLNNKVEQKTSLSTAEKIEWLNSIEYDKTINTSENDSHVLGRLISDISLKNSKIQDDESVIMKEPENEKPQITEVKKDINNIQEQEIDGLKTECENLKVSIEEVQGDLKKLFSEKNKTIALEQFETNSLESYEEQSKIKLKAFELLENEDNSIEKLDETIEAYVNKLVNLANKWEKHRSPLIDQYRNEREKYSSKAVSSISLYKFLL